MPSRILVLICCLTALACASFASGEKYEFLGGETICVDKAYVVAQKITAISGGSGKLTSISVLSDRTVIELTPDKLRNDAYFRDLATFIQMHPGSASSEIAVGLRKIDVIMRPAGEVDSQRLLDRLAPGDGSMWLVVSDSIEVGPEHGRLAEIFQATCRRGPSGASRCRRHFPILGLRADYPLPVEWEGVIERDRELRSLMARFVRPCG